MRAFLPQYNPTIFLVHFYHLFSGNRHSIVPLFQNRSYFPPKNMPSNFVIGPTIIRHGLGVNPKSIIPNIFGRVNCNYSLSLSSRASLRAYEPNKPAASTPKDRMSSLWSLKNAKMDSLFNIAFLVLHATPLALYCPFVDRFSIILTFPIHWICNAVPPGQEFVFDHSNDGMNRSLGQHPDRKPA
jgi:hypothetical protein